MVEQNSSRPLRIFLCHSSGDKKAVRELYHQLYADGFDPWLDEENLEPGQQWEKEIPRAVRNSDVVIVCLSHGSITKTGYVQKEIKFALDVADQQPEDTIFLIPVKLEECNVPERLSQWQWVNLFEERGYNRLLSSLRRRSSVSPTSPEKSNHKVNTPSVEQAGSYSSAPSIQQSHKLPRVYWTIGILSMLLGVSAVVINVNRTPKAFTNTNGNTFNSYATATSNAATNSNSNIPINFDDYGNSNLHVDEEKFERDEELLETKAEQHGDIVGAAPDDLRTWTYIRILLARLFKDVADWIQVDVENRVVTLRGTVKSREQSHSIEFEVRDFASTRYVLKGVRNELLVDRNVP